MNSITFNKYDCNASLLLTQMAGFLSSLRAHEKLNIIQYFRNVSAGKKSLLMKVVKVVKLLLVMLATYTRKIVFGFELSMCSTIRDNRRYHLMVFTFYKHRTNYLDTISISNIFLGNNTVRKEIFEMFKTTGHTETQ